MRIMKTCGLLLIIAITSCSGGSGVDPLVEPDLAAISGTVVITGAPLASLDEPTVTGGQDETKWSLKLIDPVEDVDSILIPVENVTFSALDILVEGDYLLSVSAEPAIDLSGGDLPTTPVEVSIPVSLAAGDTTLVFATLEFVPTTAASSAHSASQAGGGTVRLSYTVETAAANELGLLEIDWNGMQVRRDTNGDGKLDDENYFADSDRDGISDESMNQMRGQKNNPERFDIEGVLVEYNEQQHRILVDETWYIITEMTRIWQHTHGIHLVDLEIGQQLRVRGYGGVEGDYYAEDIRVLDQPGPGPGPPGQ